MVGELESTMMNMFSLGSNLRMSFKQSEFPESLREYEDIVSACFDQDIRGTLLDDLGWFKSHESSDAFQELVEEGKHTKGAQEHNFTPEVYEALKKYCATSGILLPFALNPTGLHLKEIQHNRIWYIPDYQKLHRNPKEGDQIFSTNGDSQVMIIGLPKGSPCPAILRDIIKIEFLGHKLEIYLAIEQRLSVNGSSEWFEKYPILKTSV